MKILKSHRDEHFLQWNRNDFTRLGHLSSIARFEYVPIKSMQRGDVTQESEAWLKKNVKQNFSLLNFLRESIPRDGMISPLILVSTRNKHWEEFVGKNFWATIPFVIQTGNNRYRIALENGYTHISSIIFGSSINPVIWNYLQLELKRPQNEIVMVDKEYINSYTGEGL